MGLISTLLLVPGLVGLLLALVPFSPRVSHFLASSASLIALALASVACWHFDPATADFQFVERASWIPELGINYEVGIDGINLFLILLTTIASVAVITIHGTDERARGFLSLFLFLELSLLGVFATLDLVLFYVFFELMLVPTYFLMNGWGGLGRSRAAIRFVLFTALGSVLMLSSIIYLGWVSQDQLGEVSFSVIDLARTLHLDSKVEAILFLGFLIAFAVKTPLVPFHTWVPSTYAESPYPLTAFMSAVMAKAGLYGFIRFVWPLFPRTLSSHVEIGVCLLAAGVIYTALIAWAQRDVKRLFAYSSISHLGICAFGVLICSTVSVSAAVFFMVAHGVVALGLFLTLGCFTSRGVSSEIVELGGLAAKIPILSCLLFLFVLGSIALPLSGNFIGEFSILLAGFAKFPFHTSFIALSTIIGAVYMLSMFRRSVLGEPERIPSVEDLRAQEFLVIVPLALLSFFIGIVPQPLLRRIEPAAERMEQFVFQAVHTPRIDDQGQEIPENVPARQDGSRDFPPGVFGASIYFKSAPRQCLMPILQEKL